MQQDNGPRTRMLTVFLIYVANCIVAGDAQDNYAVRLNNSFGNNSKEGRLEIYYSGSWGTVCDDGFTTASARVACASLGFGYMGTVIGNRYGAGSGQIWLDDVNCTGTEIGIQQCAHLQWGQHNCNHNEDVSISCECSARSFSASTGKISSPNFPLAYANNLNCYNYILAATGQKITITFLAFNTQSCCDTVTITCTSGSSYSVTYAGSQIPASFTISSCTQVRIYFYTDGSVTSTGFSLTYDISSVCANGDFFGPTGQISSPNFPMAYSNNINCSSYITVPSGQTIIITFQSFNTETCCDWVTITCESGRTFRSPSFSGSELPPSLTIVSCYRVNVNFRTDGSSTYTGFSLIYNVTSDIVMGGISNKPSNMFPHSGMNDSVIFNCTSATKYLPWWAINSIAAGNFTITNSACGVIASASYSSWFTTESLEPGSCNLIVSAPADRISLLAGSVVCTDSTLATARAILAPINLELRLMKGVNSSATVTDIIRDEEIRIACSPSFINWYLRTSLVFTYFLYSGGPLAQMRILSTYWRSQGNVISSIDTANSSSYVLVKATVGSFPRYTCNIVCNFFSNISDISGNSSIEVSFSTETVEVLYWPTEDNMKITGDNNGQILPSALLKCDAAVNPPATYKWIDESNGNITNGPTILINHSGKYTCNASNIIRGQYYHQSKSVKLQVVEDDINRLKVAAIILGALLGAAILAIVILAVLLWRKSRQQKPNSDVGHINQGNEHQLQHKGRGSNRYEYDNAVREEVAKAEYDNLDGFQRPLPNTPTVYEELRKP